MKDHEYFVYIMCSRSGTLYIGMTNSIYRRALQHKCGEIEGLSGKYHCDRLVYYESFDDVHRAIGREKQLKGSVECSGRTPCKAAGASGIHGVLRLREPLASPMSWFAQDDKF